MRKLTEQEEKRRNAILWHVRVKGWAKHDMQFLENEQAEIEDDENWARAQIAHCGSLSPEASTHANHEAFEHEVF